MAVRKAVAGLGAVLLAATGVLSVSATPAHAAGCYIVCDGVDPSSAGYEDANGVFHRCDDARTIYTIDPPTTGYVELRYSRECRMAWARGGLHGIKVEGFNSDGSYRVTHDFYSTSRIGYTRAVNDAGQTARACVLTPSGGGWTCTARY
jgi:hypothetical protein